MSACAASAAATRCLLPLLQPVRHCLLAHLSDADAARLLQTSRSAASLLAGYSLDRHCFEFARADRLQRAFAFYGRHQLSMRRIRLCRRWHRPLVDRHTGHSLLPASLRTLHVGWDVDAVSQRAIQQAAERGGEAHFEGLLRPLDADGAPWRVDAYPDVDGVFDRPIPPGALPHGLRFLQLSATFNQPLQRGSIPDSVEVLQFGKLFNQPLAAGHLPSSLVHLVFGEHYNRPLLRGVLPAGLRRLHLGRRFDEPLLLGVLPPQLEQLSLADDFDQPLDRGVIPPSVTHIRLGVCLNQSLQQGSIPHGVVHLQLSEGFNKQLSPGVLPVALRELGIGRFYTQPLEPGSLPDGLEVLCFHPRCHWRHPLLPGVLPASVVAVSLPSRYEHELGPGSIPATARWLRLPKTPEAEEDVRRVLSPTTSVVWWGC